MNRFMKILALAVLGIVTQVVQAESAVWAEQLTQNLAKLDEIEALRSEVSQIEASFVLSFDLVEEWFHKPKTVAPQRAIRRACYDLGPVVDRLSRYIRAQSAPQNAWEHAAYLKTISSLASIKYYCEGTSAPEFGLYDEIRQVLQPGDLANVKTPQTAPELSSVLLDLTGALLDIEQSIKIIPPQ